jgi:hypothetical protein
MKIVDGFASQKLIRTQLRRAIRGPERRYKWEDFVYPLLSWEHVCTNIVCWPAASGKYVVLSKSYRVRGVSLRVLKQA